MEERAFEENILRLEPKLYRMALAILWNSADAADAMQESILKAWRKLNLLKDEARFDAWLTRILINECRNIQRREKHRPMSYDDAIGDSEPISEPVADLGLQDAIRRLPEKLRLPLLLHHMDGYDLQAIAKMLRLPVSTIKGRLYEARRQLKTLLEREGER